ncbi:hypothetical protein AMES_2112 [Amycolatopsis mediterranei S699]|uniref:Uncharacterized protein n=2 Tax=Amycolatopsis mediterranei TaxID=33910 RepID=A0A0H3D0U2_AMYMU|nr:hypothetical protein [Amycolatopsis mediterranei]ADJ43935.1 hypothetical protein AMED_2130 [Amycolatopsis mediterranei U32]AEK40659.1 hypothetical protein RAM_10845 [Amycolatopsis mediterranei S699]AFO75648.1 hypothetical protein AMES_2112 [Amycolatopsis mediterranei S699]AGT82777.1 hypothetical protein B737_2113 [Amycolatopsis mediterranei RB]KDO04267.1 hypothetical protein DV26_44785 [Amycolatopsis mediterranei]
MHPDMPPKLETLADVLLARPFVAPPAVDPLMAYGYVSTPHDDPMNRHAYAAVLDLWCYTEGWVFGAWFSDVLSKPDEVVRPGFTGLIDVLPVYPRTVVLVVETGALSPQVGTALAMKAVIRRTGAALHVLDEELAEALT